MLTRGTTVPIRTLRDIAGAEVELGRGDRWTLLSFLRYASCPSCLLHVRELVVKHERLAGAGVDVVVVFHSPVGRIRRHTARLDAPFRIVSDPQRGLYRAFHVSASWPKLLTSFVRPSFVPAFVKTLVYGFWGGAIDGELARMPADFVIDGGGAIVQAYYGRHIGDHVRVDEVIALAGSRRARVRGAV
jgi:thioredoxin-dependent peroxiredoxin